MGVLGSMVSGAQIVTGSAMVWRKGKLLPDWKPRKEYPGHFTWGVIWTAAFGALSVWYGISEVLEH
jgi:hypothetical protein